MRNVLSQSFLQLQIGKFQWACFAQRALLQRRLKSLSGANGGWTFDGAWSSHNSPRRLSNQSWKWLVAEEKPWEGEQVSTSTLSKSVQVIGILSQNAHLYLHPQTKTHLHHPHMHADSSTDPKHHKSPHLQNTSVCLVFCVSVDAVCSPPPPRPG